MVFIYCLACPDTVWYVGKTTNPKIREYRHRRKERFEIGSYFIPDNVKWEFIILDEVEDEIGTDAERFYYDFLEPKCNKVIPGRSHEEATMNWRKTHPEDYYVYQRMYNSEWRRIKRLAERNSNLSHLQASASAVSSHPK